MKKIMMGVSLGLASMSQAHAWNGGIEDMRTMQDNTNGQVVRVKSTTTDCCTLRPMHSHGHKHQTKMVHNGKTYYCTRVAGHGKQVQRHSGQVKKQHYHRQAQQAVNAQRAKRQAMYAAQAKRKALLLAQKRKQVATAEAQKRRAVQLAQQKQRAAHQALLQAQQRKRAAMQLQQQRKRAALQLQHKRKLQLLAQQRRQQAAQKRVVIAAKPKPRYHAPQPRPAVAHQPRYESSYQRYHHNPAKQSVQHHDTQWQRSSSVRIQPIQQVVKKYPPKHREHRGHRFSGHQSVDRHDARMREHARVKQIRTAQIAAQKRRYAPAQQSVARHDAAHGWQRAATVQSHGMRQQHQKRQVVAMANTRRHEPDCGC
uniref:Uncharacterized protein n=1 Tax=uncultured Thiotrichaceae bacterium TaxID=298394 RepID=A0A6S6U9N7_9GAMM|nr:MAG: Unknown protein [uncultured Thiotrichaceae bacterium]